MAGQFVKLHQNTSSYSHGRSVCLLHENTRRVTHMASQFVYYIRIRAVTHMAGQFVEDVVDHLAQLITSAIEHAAIHFTVQLSLVCFLSNKIQRYSSNDLGSVSRSLLSLHQKYQIMFILYQNHHQHNIKSN